MQKIKFKLLLALLVFTTFFSCSSPQRAQLIQDDMKRPTLGLEFVKKVQQLSSPIENISKYIAIDLVKYNTPAWKAGLRTNDLILKINGKSLDENNFKNSNDISNFIKSQSLGSNINFTIYRKNYQTSIKLDNVLIKEFKLLEPITPDDYILADNKSKVLSA